VLHTGNKVYYICSELHDKGCNARADYRLEIICSSESFFFKFVNFILKILHYNIIFFPSTLTHQILQFRGKHNHDPNPDKIRYNMIDRFEIYFRVVFAVVYKKIFIHISHSPLLKVNHKSFIHF
jgi:hypothetical protein